MLNKFVVVVETHNRWPAKGDRPSGESFSLLLQDRTQPIRYALRSMYEYRLSGDEKERFWNQLEGKTIEVGITEILSGNRSPLLRGEIVSVEGEKKK